MAGALEIVDEYDVTTSTGTVILGGGTSGSSGLNVSIDSTYDTYFVTGSGAVLSAGNQIYARWLVGGSEDTTGNKKQWAQRAKYSQTVNEYRFYTSNYTEITLQNGVLAGENSAFILYLNCFPESSVGGMITVFSAYDQYGSPVGTGNRVWTRLGGAGDMTKQASDGIKIWSNANFTAGTFRLFGFVK
jgi:hypothetical protein